ncbi:MAG: hypothetical protein HC849_00715 [Oscillatoriales cyanobacterium RU_3_3]|nr:hypothetical protein [Oscillatoriales cyanobacterium RU_3_3]
MKQSIGSIFDFVAIARSYLTGNRHFRWRTANLHSIGIWRQYGCCSIELGHLRICDIKKVF